MRKIFHLALPDETVLRSWATKIDALPGFTGESFRQLEKKVQEEKEKGQEVIVQLILDEMAIMKHVRFDGTKFTGKGIYVIVSTLTFYC